MGRIKKNKHFKHPRTYYLEFLSLGILILIGIFSFWFVQQMSEEELYDEFVNRKLTQISVIRRSQLIEMLIARFFGKKGLLILITIFLILFSCLLHKEIKEFKRYKYKCRLYHEGIIKNVYDIYDDYEPQSLVKKIKNLFARRRKIKYKYPSKKELKNIENKIKNMDK